MLCVNTIVIGVETDYSRGRKLEEPVMGGCENHGSPGKMNENDVQMVGFPHLKLFICDPETNGDWRIICGMNHPFLWGAKFSPI